MIASVPIAKVISARVNTTVVLAPIRELAIVFTAAIVAIVAPAARVGRGLVANCQKSSWCYSDRHE